MADYLIRDMELADRDAVTDLIWELNRFESRISHDRITSREGAIECLASNQRKVRDGGGCHFIAEAGDTVVAYACCGVVHGEPYLRPEFRRYGYVYELVVSESWRGKGIGEALLRTCEDYFRSMNLKSAGIGVLADNMGAARLYERLGYRAHAVERVKWLD